VAFATWAQCERLLAQALACAALIEHWGFTFDEAAELLNETGSYLHGRGRYAEAEPLYERALAIAEKVLGPEHPLTKTVSENYAAHKKQAKAD
jgi:tetratricopeptide (TPR) repeat protein